MKSYLLLAFAFTVAQAIEHGFARAPLSHMRRSDFIGQSSASYVPQRYALSGRPEYSETYQQEYGNLNGGQRGGRFYSRDSGDNVRAFQYSQRPIRQYSGARGQNFGGFYNQHQSRFQDGYRRDSLGYGAGQGQVTFNAPLANTRSYNLGHEAAGNRNFGYY